MVAQLWGIGSGLVGGNTVAQTMAGDDLSTMICEALGLDAALVNRIILDIRVCAVVHVYVEMAGSDKMLCIDWEAALRGKSAKVIKVE